MDDAAANGDVCLTVVNAQGAGGGSCARAAEAAKYGVMDIEVVVAGKHAPSVTLLAPSGVTSVTMSLSDGTTSAVPVSNGVVQLADPRLVSVRYVLPSGATVNEGVPGVPAGVSGG